MDTGSHLSDQELTAQLRLGSRNAFNEIYFRHSEYLYRFAFNIIKDEDECTDAIQDVFIWLWSNKEKIQVTSLKGYLCAAVKYKLSRVIQSSKRRSEILAQRPEIEMTAANDPMEIRELEQAIDDFIETLPPKARKIFEMSRKEYLSNKEIAEKLGISTKTVENQMTITLKKLKENLGKMSFWSVLL
ncbi:putative RNA polymerase ECF-type sigma factor [Pedobacter sp. BAL39]|nr:putative RNA polymerase ECF-type sigma factor [Pedobacter sp. BAL39]